MRKLSIIALLLSVSMPAFAEGAPVAASDTLAKEVAESVSADLKQSVKQEVYAQAKQSFKDEIKAELKEEFKADFAKKKAEFIEQKHHEKIAFPNGLQFGVGASATSGLNAFIGYANKDFDSFWAKRFGVRFDFATTRPIKSTVNDAIDSVIGDGFDIGDNLTIDGAQVDATHYAAMVDFYPFGDVWLLGGWRMTGGYYMGDMSASASVASTFSELDGGTYEFELMGNQYRYMGNSVHGTADFDWEYRGPYIGTGFDIGLFSGFKIYVDAGVVFTNRAAELSLNIPTDNLQQWNGAEWGAVDIPELDAVIEETLADAQSELDDFKYYPMVKVGFMYRF